RSIASQVIAQTCVHTVASLLPLLFFFFFSSRRRHTRLVSDWSSDVCSSDLWQTHIEHQAAGDICASVVQKLPRRREGRDLQPHRSEERRVGKECRSRWSPCH